MPATIRLSEDDVQELSAAFPAEVDYGDDVATVTFNSPRAAVDFVESLHGHIPYTAGGMTVEEHTIFNDPEIRAEAAGVVSEKEPGFEGYDRIARRWGIAAFSVATSAAATGLAGLIVAIIALVS